MPKASKKAFKHLITLAPDGFTPRQAKRRKHSNLTWKENALYVMRRRYYFQVLKSNIKLKRRWWNNYCILRIGAPEPWEFLCQETFYVARMSIPSDAAKFKEYWYWCRLRSFQILEWLWNLDSCDYSWKLHQFLKGFIVTKRPILSEVERYDSKASEEISLQIFGDWRTAIYKGANEEKICAL